MIETSRRSLITGLISLIAAPAIIRATSIMPVKTLLLEPNAYSENAILEKLPELFIKTVGMDESGMIRIEGVRHWTLTREGVWQEWHKNERGYIHAP